MEVPELNLKECESVFVRDEFYENIQAPKFHDFCSNDDPVVDAEGYFRRLGGRSPRLSADPFADQNAFWGGTKDSTVLKPPGLPKAPLSSVALNTGVTSSVPKASSAGLKKTRPPVPMSANPLTKSQDKAPSKTKMYHRVSPVSNASLSSTTSDGKGNDVVQVPSTVKSCHPSENTDPNGTFPGKRKKVINSGGSKSYEGTTVTVAAALGPVRVPSHSEGDSKVASDSQVSVKSQTQIPKPSKEKSESTARRVADQVEPCDVKDRKRKPTTRNAEAGVTKVTESKSRVLKQQRKSSTFSAPDVCSGISDLGPSSSQSVRATCSEPGRASTVKPPADRRTSRRSSDNSRRRRASGTLNGRQGRKALLTGPRSNANAAQETTGDIGAQLSFSSPGQCGSKPTNKQPATIEEQTSIADGVVSPKFTSVPHFVFPGPIVTPSSIVHATELSSMVDEGSLNPCNGGASNSELSIGKGDSAGESVQTLVCSPDASVISDQQEVRNSVADILLEKLQKLQLQQEYSRAVQELEPNNESVALRTLPCVISTDDSLMLEVIKYSSGAQVECPKEHNGEITPADILNTVGAGVCTCTDIEVDEAESCMDASEVYSVSGLVPGEDQEEYGTTVDMGSQDIDLLEDASVSKMCSGTTVSGECMVEEIDQDDVLESLQNLQIQSNGSGRSESKLPCDEDAGVAISRGSCLGVEEEHSDMALAADCNEMFKSHNKVLVVDSNTAASSTQEVKTGNQTRSLKRLLSKGPSRVAQYTEIDLSSSKGHHVFITDQQKRNNKRKSIELGPHRNEQRSTNTNAIHNLDDQGKAKVALQSTLAPLTHPQLSSSVSRVAVPSGISGQHKKMKTTCPQPFRLRTEERGALKEVEFNKKVELYLAAKENMQNVPFQFTTNKDSWNTVKVPRNSSKDKMSAKQIRQHTQARAAERALFDMKVTEKSLRADEEKHEKEKRMQLEAEEEIKRMRKQMIPHAQRMPIFDRPFKPQRSTKTLTVPSSPKFHSLKAKKACARTNTQD